MASGSELSGAPARNSHSHTWIAGWAPGWSMFAAGNIVPLFLTSKADWRAMAQAAGFAVKDEGVFNHAGFAILEKPAAPPSVSAA